MNNEHPSEPTAASDAMTRLILEVFRLNGQLLAAGDRLTADLGLTSARWQVLGAVALSGEPATVPVIARNMGLTRQAVQRVVNDLAARGLVELIPNPHHKRAKLVRLTAAGERAYDEATARQIPWATALAGDLTPDALRSAGQLLRRLADRLTDDPTDPRNTIGAD